MKRIANYISYINNTSKYYEKRPIHKEEIVFSMIVPESDWAVGTDDLVWTSYTALHSKMDVQGWKIHVSTMYNNAQDTLDRVSKILIKRMVSFKHVKSKSVLHDMYSKNGSRISAGKFITIYPQREDFIPLLNEINEAVKGLPKGPYIITDKQWKNGNVYFRYGAFQKITNEQGIYCIFDDKGALIPDERKPQYYLPDFIKEPPELLQNESDIDTDKTQQSDNKLTLYNIEKALRFTNSGGIYLAKKINDEKQCIIKEARAAIGLDGQSKTAAQRLQNEYEMLMKLSNMEEIINVIDYFKVWENTFLVEEFAYGVSLFSWVAINYPFSSRVSTVEYFDKLKMILKSLIETLKEMHENGIAMCDLQPQNVMIGENLEVKLIDFEVATDINDESKSAMFTRGYFNQLNTKAKDKDWYALNRIIQFCFLPIGPVCDFDININVTQCLWIYENFEEDAYRFFYNLQLDCAKNIDKFDEIFKGTYDLAEKPNDIRHTASSITIEDVVEKLKKGLISNCNSESESLINGDIRQFESNCGMFNIQNGGFGAVLALNRLSDLCDSDSDIAEKWINRTLPSLLSQEHNNGFLTGRAGIACVLYECGYRQEACKILDIVIASYSKNMKDFSFRSGLSGIGIALVALYKMESNPNYLEEAKNIAAILLDLPINDEVLIGTDWDSVSVGLLDGYSGISMFYALLYHVTHDTIYLDNAIKMIQEDIDRSKIADKDGVLQTFDTAKNRLLPYLSNGSIGMGLAITTLNSISEDNLFLEELRAINKVTDYRCCFEPALFDGIAGFFLVSCFENSLQDINKSLDVLKLFLIEEGDCAFIPGKFFYKYSSDLHTGTAGVLLALVAARKQNPLYWLPIVHTFLK